MQVNTPDLAARIQQAVTQSMAGRAGTAVALDVGSGRILASYRLDVAARTLARPGSTVKPFALWAALESGKMTPERPLLCRRQVRLASRQLDCSHVRTAQPMTASLALAYSCNSYFAQLAALLTDTDLTQAFARAGFSSPTGLAEREATGVIRPPRTVEERQLLALGEGEIEITPLELLAAYRKLALLRRKPDPTPGLQAVFDGLEGSVSYGMGHMVEVKGLEIAGKTGTASSGGGWTHAWFAGYAPARAPQIVLVVFLTQGRGGLDAAPIAGEIFAAYVRARSAR